MKWEYSEAWVPITNQFQVVMYLQAAINISFQVVLTFVFVLTFVLTCIGICFQEVIYKLLHVVSTNCYKHFFSSCLDKIYMNLKVVTRVYKLLQCTSSSCINTFGNDVAARSMTYNHVRKSRSEMT